MLILQEETNEYKEEENNGQWIQHSPLWLARINSFDFMVLKMYACQNSNGDYLVEEDASSNH